MRAITTYDGVTLSCVSTAAEPFRLCIEQDGQSLEILLGNSACIRLMAEVQAHLNTDNSYIQRETDGQVTAILDGVPLLCMSGYTVRVYPP